MTHILSEEIIALMRFIDLKYDPKHIYNLNTYSYKIKPGYEDLISNYINKMCKYDNGKSFWSWMIIVACTQIDSPEFYEAANNHFTNEQLLRFIELYRR